MFLCCRVRMLFWGLDSESKLSNHCSPAHPLERVVVLAPGPLYGRSPRRWAGSMLALDSLWEEAKSWDPGDDGEATVELGESAPGLLGGLNFQPGGVCRLGE